MPDQQQWKSSACILCSINCGIEVQLGGEDNKHIVRTRGDKSHPSSQGYLCQKASGLDHYQNGRDRLTSPLRRKPDGSFEEIDWDTAIREVSDKLLAVKKQHGGDKIFYYGGGGQGNHLPGAYSTTLRNSLGVQWRSNALAQEKTGEFWVNNRLFGTHIFGDFEHCDVAIFLGKNPWHSHGIPRARAWLKEVSKDSSRKIITIDPVITETAKLSDIHLRVKPGTDAWLIAALIGLIVQRKLYKPEWLQQHTLGATEILSLFASLPVQEYLDVAGIALQQAEETTQLIGAAKGLAMHEDLGVQMNRNSTLVSYLEKLLWLLCGHFGNKGGQNVPAFIQNIAGSGRNSRKSPVVGAQVISGLVPCNVISDEILTDHPDRYRAMIIESANPVHSLADSKRFSEALRSLDTVVVIDVAMSETAKQADYVLPAATQYEKWEATFFNFEFPENYFHLRKPLFTAPEGALSEAEIHARLAEAMGVMPIRLCEELVAAFDQGGRDAYRERFFQAMAENPDLVNLAPVVLYRTLGPRLPEGAAEAAVLWPLAMGFAGREPASLARAGFEGDPLQLGDALFEAMLSDHSGLVFSVDDYADSWQRLGNEGKVQLVIPEMLAELAQLYQQPASLTTEQFPFVLMAGERRDYTANTIYRDPSWRRKDPEGALRISPEDAQRLGLENGSKVRVSTQTGSATTPVDINDRMMPGHVSLPNGFGLDNEDGTRSGVAPNELTSVRDRDDFAGTPWHKYVAAQLETVA